MLSSLSSAESTNRALPEIMSCICQPPGYRVQGTEVQNQGDILLCT